MITVISLFGNYTNFREISGGGGSILLFTPLLVIFKYIDHMVSIEIIVPNKYYNFICSNSLEKSRAAKALQSPSHDGYLIYVYIYICVSLYRIY